MNIKHDNAISTRLHNGLLHDRFLCCRKQMIPHMWNILQDKDLCHCWENFKIASGQAEGTHQGPPFHDGDFYKWMEAVALAFRDEPEDHWIKHLDTIIDLLAEIQQDNGYIFTLDAINRKNGEEILEMQNELNFEVYNLGHLMSAACAHFKATGRNNFLELAEKAAFYLKKRISSDEEIRTAICPSHYMGLAQLFEVTENPVYIDLLKTLIEFRNRISDGTDDNQDRLPLNQHKEITGHAVRANYLYAGLTDLYRHQGGESYKKILKSVWKDLVSKKISLTGGCGALYDGVSPYGHDDYFYIQRTHQSYGRAYELPNLAGYNETCAAIGHYLWNFRMLKTFTDGKYGDYMERGLYNSILSGINIDGNRYFYTNALRSLETNPHKLKWSRHREAYIESFCCPPNILRTIAAIPDHIAIPMKNGFGFILYCGSTIKLQHNNDNECLIKMETDYPLSGEINITMEKNSNRSPFSLYLRIPEWTENYSCTVNGYPFHDKKTKKGFLEINRTWQTGDSLSLSLEMKPRITESHPLVEESRNHIAVERGPFVYCLESKDLPSGTAITEMYYKSDTPFIDTIKSIKGVDLPILTIDLWADNNEKWNDKKLYRTRQKGSYTKSEVQLIPYFAWDNREPGEMTVWLPLLPYINNN